MRALSGDIHSGHSATEEESEHGGSSSSPGQGNPGTNMDDSLAVTAFKCPKTKKVALSVYIKSTYIYMNNNRGVFDPVDPVEI